MNDSVFILDGYEALGTRWYIEIFQSVRDSTKEALSNELIEYIEDFQKKYSRFDTSSLLSTLNREKKVPYDFHLAKMLTLAQDMHVRTKGIFNIYIEKKLIKKGYGARYEEVPLVIDSINDSHKMESLFRLTDHEIILHGDASIDLGGIGKGYLIDLLSLILKEQGIEQFLINGGGDLYMTHNQGKGIEVYLQHPKQKDILIGKMTLINNAFCSSSSYTRAWEQDGILKNHFITPTNEEVWAASFVVGDSACTSDMMATVLCITSDDKELSYTLARDTGVEFLVENRQEKLFGDLFPRISMC